MSSDHNRSKEVSTIGDATNKIIGTQRHAKVIVCEELCSPMLRQTKSFTGQASPFKVNGNDYPVLIPIQPWQYWL